ncbi:hypothetical protein SODALDRAFT_376958 [Sodiomyces alkalinus F11]|uniref:Uncharacterized protein n=1 Tax=Sodiomyces alkalinus (strain CBS 110278 / VKM F-3762 / F11) TaxID=1314773 RepID=A0A3N2Q3C5_SODAK|nr:hypothetical protein SODALDRAFT_376958 [Sodiomyces alkalinus F11]ROT41260.1 hypothetical protein SODALDRAFT_376958 [Sodiomyces alkalinus F11]
MSPGTEPPWHLRNLRFPLYSTNLIARAHAHGLIFGSLGHAMPGSILANHHIRHASEAYLSVRDNAESTEYGSVRRTWLGPDIRFMEDNENSSVRLTPTQHTYVQPAVKHVYKPANTVYAMAAPRTLLGHLMRILRFLTITYIITTSQLSPTRGNRSRRSIRIVMEGSVYISRILVFQEASSTTVRLLGIILLREQGKQQLHTKSSD